MKKTEASLFLSFSLSFFFVQLRPVSPGLPPPPSVSFAPTAANLRPLSIIGPSPPPLPSRLTSVTSFHPLPSTPSLVLPNPKESFVVCLFFSPACCTNLWLLWCVASSLLRQGSRFGEMGTKTKTKESDCVSCLTILSLTLSHSSPFVLALAISWSPGTRRKKQTKTK